MNTTTAGNKSPEHTPSGEDEIDLLELAKTAWDGRKTILRSVIIVAVLAVVLAFLKSPDYTASTTMVPQTAKSSAVSGSLSSLASLAGIDLSANSDGATLSPLVYPQIVGSVPFQLELMKTKFNFPDQKQKISLFDYYTSYQKEGTASAIKKYTIGLPGTLLKAIRGKQPEAEPTGDSTIIHLSRDQYQVRQLLQQQLTVDINNKEGYITLSSTFFDPSLAAQVAQKAKTMLQRYINRYKMEKARDQLDFIRARFTEKKKEFEEAQETLARFNDRNKYVSSALARTEGERLQSEYNIAFDVYSTLAKQLEQAQIQAKEDTPILTTIEPVQVPLQKNGMGKISFLILGLLLGGIIGTGLVFAREFLTTLKAKWGVTESQDEKPKTKDEK